MLCGLGRRIDHAACLARMTNKICFLWNEQKILAPAWGRSNSRTLAHYLRISTILCALERKEDPDLCLGSIAILSIRIELLSTPCCSKKVLPRVWSEHRILVFALRNSKDLQTH